MMTVAEAEHALALAAERTWDKFWESHVRDCAELEQAVLDLRAARAQCDQMGIDDSLPPP